MSSMDNSLCRCGSIIAACREMVDMLADTSALEAEREKARTHSDELLETMQDMVRENARTAQDQAVYDEKYGALTERYQQATDHLKELDGQLLERRARPDRLNAYMDALDESKLRWLALQAGFMLQAF